MSFFVNIKAALTNAQKVAICLEATAYARGAANHKQYIHWIRALINSKKFVCSSLSPQLELRLDLTVITKSVESNVSFWDRKNSVRLS